MASTQDAEQEAVKNAPSDEATPSSEWSTASDSTYGNDVPPLAPAAAVIAAPVDAAVTKAMIESPAPFAAAPAAQTTPRPVGPRPAPAAGLQRWGDVQQLTLGFRYRIIENSAGVRTHHQGQGGSGIKARAKFDRAARYTLNAGVFTGASNTSSWNNTGLGSGERARDFHLKQLFVSAAPAAGLELQHGGIYVTRGESTEITTYDNDSYLTGQRVTVKRPKQLYFDEISATQAYLGDSLVPDIWNRYKRVGEPNYYQFLVGKKVGTRLGLSADYTDVDGVPTWRSAFGLRVPETAVLDGVRVETYARSVSGPTVFGCAITADKKVRRALLSGGFASVDEQYGGLNGDFFVRGDRWFGKASVGVFRMLTVTTLYTHALDADYVLSNRERFDVVVSYDVLKTFAPAPRR